MAQLFARVDLFICTGRVLIWTSARRVRSELGEKPVTPLAWHVPHVAEGSRKKNSFI